MAEWTFGKYWRSMVHLGLIPIDLRFMKWNNVWFMFVCNWWLWLGKQNINEVSMRVGWILLSIVILEVLDVISLLGCLILNCCSNWVLCLCHALKFYSVTGTKFKVSKLRKPFPLTNILNIYHFRLNAYKDKYTSNWMYR